MRIVELEPRRCGNGMALQIQTCRLFRANRVRSQAFSGRRLPSTFSPRFIRCATAQDRSLGTLTGALRLSTMGQLPHASQSAR